MRILPQALGSRCDTDFLKESDCADARLLCRGMFVMTIVFGQLIPNCLGRVQRRHGFLKNHRHAIAAQIIDATLVGTGDIFA